MSSSANKSFDRGGVADYEKRRYRGLDQRLVDRRERRILGRMLREIARNAPENPPGGRTILVLDAPCGYGRFTNLILGRGARLVSSDISFHMVERVMTKRDNARHLGGVVADFKRGLPFKPGAFDYVFSMRLFHHLQAEEDRKAVLGEFARAARKGAILSFYRTLGLHVLQRKIRRLFKKTQRNIRMVSGETFQREAAGAGFTIERIRPLFRGIHAQHIALLRKS